MVEIKHATLPWHLFGAFLCAVCMLSGYFPPPTTPLAEGGWLDVKSLQVFQVSPTFKVKTANYETADLQMSFH